MGIDPGSRRAGYAIIQETNQGPILKEAGLLPIEGEDEGKILQGLRAKILLLLNKYQPAACGVERLYFSKNQKTAMAVSQARGAVLSAIGEANVRVIEITPNEVKLAVAGNGSADKAAVAKMVRLLLNNPKLTLIDDAMDAVAIALSASRRHRLDCA